MYMYKLPIVRNVIGREKLIACGQTNRWQFHYLNYRYTLASCESFRTELDGAILRWPFFSFEPDLYSLFNKTARTWQLVLSIVTWAQSTIDLHVNKLVFHACLLHMYVKIGSHFCTLHFTYTINRSRPSSLFCAASKWKAWWAPGNVRLSVAVIHTWFPCRFESRGFVSFGRGEEQDWGP